MVIYQQIRLERVLLTWNLHASGEHGKPTQSINPLVEGGDGNYEEAMTGL